MYYYGARYLDPKYSIWISADPALGEYIPGAPVNDEVRKHNQNLPGMGGVFNTVNLHLYHYAGNNPVKYTDPDGRDITDVGNIKQTDSTGKLGNGKATIADEGCTLATFVRMANALGADVSMDKANEYALENGLFLPDKEGNLTLLSPENGAALVNGLVKNPMLKVVYVGSAYGTTTELASAINAKEYSKSDYFVTARIGTGNTDGTEKYDHSISINSKSVFFSGDFSNIDKVLGFKYNDTSNANRTGTNDTSRINNPSRVDFFWIQKQNWAMMENAK